MQGIGKGSPSHIRQGSDFSVRSSTSLGIDIKNIFDTTHVIPAELQHQTAQSDSDDERKMPAVQGRGKNLPSHIRQGSDFSVRSSTSLGIGNIKNIFDTTHVTPAELQHQTAQSDSDDENKMPAVQGRGKNLPSHIRQGSDFSIGNLSDVSLRSNNVESILLKSHTTQVTPATFFEKWQKVKKLIIRVENEKNSAKQDRIVLVEDPENVVNMINRSTLRSRRYGRKEVIDPNNPENKIKQGALNARKSYQTEVPDPEKLGQMVTQGTLSNRNYSRKEVPDPDNLGQMVKQGTLNSRKTYQTEVPNPEKLGQMVKQGTLNKRKRIKRKAEAYKNNEQKEDDRKPAPK